MTSQAPAAGESLVGHLHGPEPDLVNRADVPTGVMQAGTFRLREGNHAVIAAVNAV